MSKGPLPLEQARVLADRITAELAPYCLDGLCTVAGSIRRRRPFVNDIDIVCLPRNSDGLRYRVFQKARKEVDAEDTLRAVLANGVQVDVWLAKPETRDFFQTKRTNFGSLLLNRTGSIRHNVYLLQCAARLDLRWNPYYGVFDKHGKCLASATEEEIFQVLQLDFIPPEKRER